MRAMGTFDEADHPRERGKFAARRHADPDGVDLSRDLDGERPSWAAAKAALEDIETLGPDEFPSRAAYDAAHGAAYDAFDALDSRSASPETVAAAIDHVEALRRLRGTGA